MPHLLSFFYDNTMLNISKCLQHVPNKHSWPSTTLCTSLKISFYCIGELGLIETNNVSVAGNILLNWISQVFLIFHELVKSLQVFLVFHVSIRTRNLTSIPSLPSIMSSWITSIPTIPCISKGPYTLQQVTSS